MRRRRRRRCCLSFVFVRLAATHRKKNRSKNLQVTTATSRKLRLPIAMSVNDGNSKINCVFDKKTAEYYAFWCYASKLTAYIFTVCITTLMHVGPKMYSLFE